MGFEESSKSFDGSIMKKNSIFYHLARKYKTPWQVQQLLHQIPYNNERDGVSLRSALSAYEMKTCHCFEGAFLAAAILEYYDHPPVVVDLESKDGLDHVIFVFQQSGFWGSVAKSRESGLAGRRPVFRTLKDLVWSYYDPYIDLTAKLKSYQVVHLDEIGVDWRTSEKNLWSAERYLLQIPHQKLPVAKNRFKKVLFRYRSGIRVPSQPSWW